LLDRAAVGLVFEGSFNPPFPVLQAELHLVVTIFNDDALEFVPVDVHHVLRLPPGLDGIRPLAFVKLDEDPERHDQRE
jgi:hypothetical protein